MKILKIITYILVFLTTLLPLPWSSFRLKTVGWTDLIVLFFLIFWIYNFFYKFRKQLILRDFLLIIPLAVTILMTIWSGFYFVFEKNVFFQEKIVNILKVNTYFFLIIIVSFIIWWYLEQISKRRYVLKTPLDIPIMLFLIFCIFSFVNSKDIERSLFMFKVILTGVIIYYLLMDIFIKDNEIIQKFIYFFLASATIVSLIGILQYFTGWPKYFIGVSGLHYIIVKGISNCRVSSTMQHPNLLGQMLILSFFTNLGILFDKRRWFLNKILNFISLGFIGLCIIFTYSRSTWLACFLGLVGFFIIKFKEYRSKIIFMIVIFLIIGSLFFQPVIQRIKNTVEDDLSTISRLEAWKSSWVMFKEHPLMGNGLNNFYVIFPRYKTKDAPFLMEDAHNTFINLIVETGIFGLISFIWLIFLFLKNSIFKNDFSLVLSIAVLSLLAAGFFENIWFDLRITALFWTFISLGLAYGN